MISFTRILLAGISTLLFSSIAYSTSIPNSENPTTFLGPTLRLGFTHSFNDYMAYNLSGEAGVKNFRVDGTLGWALTDNQYFKITGEYLRQRITYSFFSGNSDQWVQQGALGAAYQYVFCNYSFLPEFNLSAYVSHAPSKNLDTVNGVYNNAGILFNFMNMRRIAGSNGAGVAPGIAIKPWQSGRISAALNYDSVRYDNKYGFDHDAVGLGGTLGVNQLLADNIAIDLTASVRQPFNLYAANLSWGNIQYYGSWTLSLFGNYTAGKETLPNTWNVGLGINYSLDSRPCIKAPVSLKGDYKDEIPVQPIRNNLLNFTADPAVYMPQVLAIADESVSTQCSDGGVSVVSFIPGIVIFGIGSESINFAATPFFSGNNLIYSATVNGTTTATVTMTPQGLLTVNNTNNVSSFFTITVTASNSCASASYTLPVTILSIDD